MSFKQSAGSQEDESQGILQWTALNAGSEMFFLGQFGIGTKDCVYFLEDWEAGFAVLTNHQWRQHDHQFLSQFRMCLQPQSDCMRPVPMQQEGQLHYGSNSNCNWVFRLRNYQIRHRVVGKYQPIHPFTSIHGASHCQSQIISGIIGRNYGLTNIVWLLTCNCPPSNFHPNFIVLTGFSNCGIPHNPNALINTFFRGLALQIYPSFISPPYSVDSFMSIGDVRYSKAYFLIESERVLMSIYCQCFLAIWSKCWLQLICFYVDFRLSWA